MYEVSSCTQVLGFSFNIMLLSFFQIGNTGFSIGAAKKANRLSLVIGPGAGYNLVSHDFILVKTFVKLKFCVVEWNSRPF